MSNFGQFGASESQVPNPCHWSLSYRSPVHPVMTFIGSTHPPEYNELLIGKLMRARMPFRYQGVRDHSYRGTSAIPLHNRRGSTPPHRVIRVIIPGNYENKERPSQGIHKALGMTAPLHSLSSDVVHFVRYFLHILTVSVSLMIRIPNRKRDKWMLLLHLPIDTKTLPWGLSPQSRASFTCPPLLAYDLLTFTIIFEEHCCVRLHPSDKSFAAIFV